MYAAIDAAGIVQALAKSPSLPKAEHWHRQLKPGRSLVRLELEHGQTPELGDLVHVDGDVGRLVRAA